MLRLRSNDPSDIAAAILSRWTRSWCVLVTCTIPRLPDDRSPTDLAAEVLGALRATTAAAKSVSLPREYQERECTDGFESDYSYDSDEQAVIRGDVEFCHAVFEAVHLPTPCELTEEVDTMLDAVQTALPPYLIRPTYGFHRGQAEIRVQVYECWGRRLDVVIHCKTSGGYKTYLACEDRLYWDTTWLLHGRLGQDWPDATEVAHEVSRLRDVAAHEMYAYIKRWLWPREF